MTLSFKTLFFILSSIIIVNMIFSYMIFQWDPILENRFMILSIWKMILAISVLFIFKKVQLDQILVYKKNFWIILVIGIILLLFCFIDIRNTLAIDQQEVSLSLQIWYLFSAISTGGFEEILFRLFVFNSFYTLLKKVEINKRCLHSVLYTSLLFGIVHMGNLLKPDYSFISVINQIVIAIGIGILLQSILIRFKNIIIVIVLHGLFNYYGMYTYYLYSKSEEVAEVLSLNEHMMSFILTLVFVVIISSIGFLMIRKHISKEGISKPITRNPYS